jgi:hypothetical protein
MKKTSIVKLKAATEITEGELINELEYLRVKNAELKNFDALLQEKRLRAKKKRNNLRTYGKSCF